MRGMKPTAKTPRIQETNLRKGAEARGKNAPRKPFGTKEGLALEFKRAAGFDDAVLAQDRAEDLVITGE